MCTSPRVPNLRIGAHTLGGVEGLIGGYQLVRWKRPPGELVYARATDLACIIKNVYKALHAVKGKEGTLLAMSARNEEKDTVPSLRPGIFAATPKSRFNPLPHPQVAQP